MNGILTFVAYITDIAEGRAIGKASIQIGKKILSRRMIQRKTHADYTALTTGITCQNQWTNSDGELK